MSGLTTAEQDLQLVRHMADSLDCLIEEDFQLLAGATANTVEAWRKRRKGPAPVRLGTRYLYPRKSIAEYLQALVSERTPALSGKDVL